MSEIIPFKKLAQPQDLVLRFMHSVGHKQDAEFYLSLFTSLKPESFAIIVLEEDVLKDDLDAIIFEIRYLMRLSLFPVVLLHSSSDFMEQLEIENYFKKAKIAANILSHEYTRHEQLEFIKDRIKRRQLPLLHIDTSLDLAAELTDLANVLRTGKIIFLKHNGELTNTKTQAPLGLISIKFEKETILSSQLLSKEDERFLLVCDKIIQSCNHKLYISILSPNNLLRELFTVKGAGTMVQLGSQITKLSNLESIDPNSLKKLLRLCFAKTIKDDFLKNKYGHVYLEENYMGAALLQDFKDKAYLSLFAVGTEARGLGIGRDLWNELTRNHKKIFWRSRPDKFITHWYTKQCDGMHRTESWTVFWKGLDPDEVSEAIEFAIKQKVDFD